VAAVLSGLFQKYGFIQSDTKSLPHFIKKLKEKKQTDLQQKQVADAIYIYYGEETIREDKTVLSKTNNKIISSKKNKLKTTNASWVPEYNDLNAEIKIRRYSPSTKTQAVFIANWNYNFQFATLKRNSNQVGLFQTR